VNEVFILYVFQVGLLNKLLLLWCCVTYTHTELPQGPVHCLLHSTPCQDHICTPRYLSGKVWTLPPVLQMKCLTHSSRCSDQTGYYCQYGNETFGFTKGMSFVNKTSPASFTRKKLLCRVSSAIFITSSKDLLIQHFLSATCTCMKCFKRSIILCRHFWGKFTKNGTHTHCYYICSFYGMVMFLFSCTCIDETMRSIAAVYWSEQCYIPLQLLPDLRKGYILTTGRKSIIRNEVEYTPPGGSEQFK